MVKYWDKATKLATSFEKFTLLHVPREQNEKADLLSKLAGTQRSGNNRMTIHKKSANRRVTIQSTLEGVTNVNSSQTFTKLHQSRCTRSFHHGPSISGVSTSSALPGGGRTGKIPDCSNGLLYKVDRGRANRHHLCGIG
ncbi:hypothetical protein CR513_09891, partial [Mucuna pruriens]